MKKFILFIALSVLIISCKSKSATDTKLDSKTQVAMKGNWTVTSVTYPNSSVFKVNSFELADSQCFVGSKWKFVSNNNKGNFSLNSPKCTAYSTPITWFVNKDGQFVMKVLDESKARKVKDGYVLKVANITDNSFQLVDQIDVAGKATDVVYQFNRN
ncbi:MAG: lipocalin family protein [Flavobacterium sp.]|uniref:lipocalin family protein n=1 Tax=Flavobacterium sp. TaxID=239 RepID=UPI0032650167